MDCIKEATATCSTIKGCKPARGTIVLFDAAQRIPARIGSLNYNTPREMMRNKECILHAKCSALSTLTMQML